MKQPQPEHSSGHKLSRTLGGVRRFLSTKLPNRGKPHPAQGNPAPDITDKPGQGRPATDIKLNMRERLLNQIDQARDFTHTTPGSRLVLMSVVSVVMGVLLTGIVLPFVGGVGLVAKAGATIFNELPSEIKTPVLGEKSTVLAADGSHLANFYNYRSNRIVVPLEEISPLMQQAMMAIEDARFYEHGGIDLKGTLRALVNTSSGEEVQGGSTLTQQYVKNVLIENALQREDDQGAVDARVRKGKEGYARKLRELRYASELEKQQQKNEILKNYLNIAYFGNGTYGIETAANRYFSKTAKKLDVRESALIAGIVRYPTAYDPFKYPKAALERRNVVISRMAELGMITPEAAHEAQSQDLGLQRSTDQSGCENVEFGAFCDWVRREMSNDPVFGQARWQRTTNLFDGGLTIRTTLDPRIQRAGQKAISDHVFPEDQVVGTLVTVEPGSGNIRAMANSRGFGSQGFEEKINYAGDIQTGGSRGFQAGSTFKIFTSAAALQQGFGLQHTIMSPYRISVPDVKRCPDLNTVENYHPGAGYSPSNADDGENGPYDMRRAFAMSVNTYYVQLQGQLEGGICPIAKLADEMGIKRANDLQPLDQFSPFTLGFNSISPTALTAAYAGFAARGKFCEATAITQVLDRNDQPMEIPDNNCRQVVPTGVADAVNVMAEETLNGTGSRAKLADGRPQAGKTGTHERKTLWYIGYTPNLVTSVGSYKPHATTHADQEIRNERIGGRTPAMLGGGSVWYGGTLGIPIWKQAMDEMLKDIPVAQFPPMDPKYEQGTKDHSTNPQAAPPAPQPPATGQPGTTSPTPDAPTGSETGTTTQHPTTRPRTGTTTPRRTPGGTTSETSPSGTDTTSSPTRTAPTTTSPSTTSAPTTGTPTNNTDTPAAPPTRRRTPSETNLEPNDQALDSYSP